MQDQQLTFSFDPAEHSAFATCREYVQYLTQHQMKAGKRVYQKVIASEMDLAPTTLSRKLGQGENDSQRFTLDDLERWIEVTGDPKPIYWLAFKHCSKSDEVAMLRERLAELESAP